MRRKRARVGLPGERVRKIDALVGPRGRNASLVETATKEVKRRRLLAFLQSDEPAWRDEDHPELADGTEAWVRSLRTESGDRL